MNDRLTPPRPRGLPESRIVLWAALLVAAWVQPSPQSPDLVFSRIAAGASHVCGITTKGTAYCWGSNYAGQLGSPTTERCKLGTYLLACSTRPTQVSGKLTFVSISAGDAHTCGVTADSAAYCWGSQEGGELGASTTETCETPDLTFLCSRIPLKVSGGIRFLSVSLGSGYACGISTSQAAYCWGLDRAGRLGAPPTELCGGPSRRCNRAPVLVKTVRRLVSVSAGMQHACAIADSGVAYCWGNNGAGQIGSSTGTTCILPTGGEVGCAVAPVAVSGNLKWTSVAASKGYPGHTCGLTTGNRAYCWGSNPAGQLGGSATETCSHPDAAPCSRVPLTVSGNVQFSLLALGATHTCGIASGESTFCWGSNAAGQIGPVVGQQCVNQAGSFACSAEPVRVPEDLSFSTLTAGDGFTCGLTPPGIAYCWGGNENGELGRGRADAGRNITPARVTAAR